jgi:hypothetical protein
MNSGVDFRRLTVKNRGDEYQELLANIRRLTIMVLDELDEG